MLNHATADSDWASCAAVRAQDTTRTDTERYDDLMRCVTALERNISVDICCAALYRCAPARLLPENTIHGVALSLMRQLPSDKEYSILQMVIANGVTGSSLFCVIKTVALDACPLAARGARCSWARLDALYHAVKNGWLKADEPDMDLYMAAAWAHYKSEPCSAAIAVLVPLTAALGGATFDDVITLMRTGSLDVSCGYDLMQDMWQAAAPTASEADLWLACIVDHLGSVHGDVVFSDRAKAMLDDLMADANPKALAYQVVGKNAWVVINEVDRLPPRFAAEAARLMAPVIAAHEPDLAPANVQFSDPVVMAATALFFAAPDEAIHGGLYTGLCLVCPDAVHMQGGHQYGGPSHSADGIDHVAFCRAWQSRPAADRFIARDRVLLGYMGADYFKRVLEALARRHSADEAWVQHGLHAWTRAWAWHRRKDLVLCAALARPCSGAKKRKAIEPATGAAKRTAIEPAALHGVKAPLGAPKAPELMAPRLVYRTSHWTNALAFVEQGDIGCELTKLIASYL